MNSSMKESCVHVRTSGFVWLVSPVPKSIISFWREYTFQPTSMDATFVVVQVVISECNK